MPRKVSARPTTVTASLATNATNTVAIAPSSASRPAMCMSRAGFRRNQSSPLTIISSSGSRPTAASAVNSHERSASVHE